MLLYCFFFHKKYHIVASKAKGVLSYCYFSSLEKNKMKMNNEGKFCLQIIKEKIIFPTVCTQHAKSSKTTEKRIILDSFNNNKRWEISEDRLPLTIISYKLFFFCFFLGRSVFLWDSFTIFFIS